MKRCENICSIAAKAPVRPLAEPFVVAPPTSVRIRTRLDVGPEDEAVLRAIARHLGRLASRDLADRVRRRRGDTDRTRRKRVLTAASSSRWAGAITRTNDDVWRLAWRNLVRQERYLHSSISVLAQRLAAPCGGRDARGISGYADQAERFQKQRRLMVLKARLRHVERRLEEGAVSICRGGKSLARARHNLEDAGLTLPQWRERWEAERCFVTADGERDKHLGNETIRWDPERATLEIRLPTPLAHLANAPAGRYRLVRVAFAYRGDEVAAQTSSGAVRYDIAYDPKRRCWYLDASWTFDRTTAPLDELRQRGVLGVDLNAAHLAAWILDPHGNPVGDPLTIPLDLADLRSTQRDGRLRGAISRLIRIARARGRSALAIEDLDFARDRGVSRETRGRGHKGRTFRRMIHGLPTAQFRSRLVQMAANAGLSIIAVDPAYTSKWGGEYWQGPLQRERHSIVSTHHGAAVVIGRRGLGLGPRRRIGVTARQQCHAAGRTTLQARPNAPTARKSAPTEDAGDHPSGPKSSARKSRAPRTVRGARRGAHGRCTRRRNGAGAVYPQERARARG